MPTGYTADVADGKVADFPAFALQCARNFGALIMMRDAPMDAPIPDEFQPSPYYAQEAAKLEAQLSSLRDLTPTEAAERMQEEYDAALRSWQERRDRQEQTRARYEAMYREVRAWTPPTPDHEGMKKFMLEQLEESLKWDCSHAYDNPPARPDPSTSQWLDEKIAKTEQRLADAREQAQREVERTASRNEWVRALRESLAVAQDGAS